MNLIILGPQGSGKGTQASMLANHFDLEHIDMGKYLREVALLDTSLGREIHEIINVRKEIVNDRILKKVIHVKLQDMPREKGIVFDGVPRKQDQLEYFEEAMLEFGRALDSVIVINTSVEESIKRISRRRVCEKCKRVYIMGKNIQREGEDCECGGKIAHRIDDTPDGVKKRLDIYYQETKPIVDYYREKGLLIEINGEQGPEEVFQEILAKLEEIN